MAKIVTLIFSEIGAGADNFSLFSDVDSFTSAFETGVTRVDLLTGYTSSVVPDSTTIVRVKANLTCLNYTDLVIQAAPTTTTTTTV